MSITRRVADVYNHTFDPDLIYLIPQPLRIEKKKELPPTRPIINLKPSRPAPPPPQKAEKRKCERCGLLNFVAILCSSDK